MPNIWSCSRDWFEQLKMAQPKVVVASWRDGSERVNEWLEKLQRLEDEGVSVFVIDGETCTPIVDSIGAKENGETIVFDHGAEKGRVTPAEDLEAELEKVRELTR